ncbi:MAG TPA: response regulator [Anaerolineales bacterium]|nr:response regulator [Anaerolineales bacterium]
MAKILIVDDDAETTQLLEAILDTGGHEPFAINESTNALSTVETVMPDLILLDIMMPQINGIAVCKLLKSDTRFNRIPVIMISALSDEGTKKDASNAGAEKFITKPILPSDLLRQIDELLPG